DGNTESYSETAYLPVGMSTDTGSGCVRQRQHRAAACGRTAAAAVVALQRPCERLVDHQAVVVEQFRARRNVLQCVDRHPGARLVLARLAVGSAAVFDPAGVVATLVAVDHHAAAEREIEGVVEVVRV